MGGPRKRTLYLGFAPLHIENRPGDRLIDQFGEFRIRINMKAPPKADAEAFQTWKDEKFLPLLEERLRDPHSLVIFTDGSVKKNEVIDKFQSGAAFAIYRADDHEISRRVEECFVGCGCVTSYDAECMAMAMAIAHAKAYMENQLPDGGEGIHDIHIYTDNRSAGSTMLNPGLGPSQMVHLQAIKNVRWFLESNPLSNISFNWCPAHQDIAQNEYVDEQAKKALDLDQPEFISWSIARERTVAYMLRSWRRKISSNVYLRTENLLYPQKYRIKVTHIAKRHLPFKHAGRNNRLMARFTRAVTGHAPIGEFRDRFNLDGELTCTCGEVTGPAWNRKHTILKCQMWYRRTSWWSRQLQNLERLDPFMGLIPFLIHNPLVFTFEAGDLLRLMLEELDEDNISPPPPPRRDLDPDLGTYTGELGHDQDLDDLLEDMFNEYLVAHFPDRLEMGPHTRRFLQHIRFNTWIQPSIQKAINEVHPGEYAAEWNRLFGKPVPNALDFDNTPLSSQASADSGVLGMAEDNNPQVADLDENGSQIVDEDLPVSIASDQSDPWDIEDMYADPL